MSARMVVRRSRSIRNRPRTSSSAMIATAHRATGVAKATAAPAATRKPARGGPTNSLEVNSAAYRRPLARESCSRGTTCGTRAFPGLGPPDCRGGPGGRPAAVGTAGSAAAPHHMLDHRSHADDRPAALGRAGTHPRREGDPTVPGARQPACRPTWPRPRRSTSTASALAFPTPGPSSWPTCASGGACSQRCERVLCVRPAQRGTPASAAGAAAVLC